VNEASLIELLKTQQFLELFVMNFNSVLIGLFIIGSSKSYGEETLGDEGFLTIVATAASVFNIFRFVWSFLMQKYSFKTMYCALLIIQQVVGVVLPLLTTYLPKAAFTKYFFLFGVGMV